MDLNPKAHPLFNGEEKNLSSYKLDIAETDGSLKWSGSTILNEDNVIRDSLSYDGTRVITFAPVLKWGTLPLVDILKDLISMGKEALGCEVEIEFAVNIFDDPNKKPEFSLLQIKPMVMGGSREIINIEEGSNPEILCSSKIYIG
ncbi:MAG: hypothetical protein CM1200mP10_21690 [Candidatus Neomarinimicrobiota bacterium]|nr:MAG: hypothetical protein CM1200mP10_21690 [Candidatus Neomarinimicrobiota bacterium]